MTDDVAGTRAGLRASELYEPGQLSIMSEREGDVHLIGLSGELDLATAKCVEEELRRVETTNASSIVLDLSDLKFMDSTGVQLVLLAHTRSADSHRLTLLRGPRAVQRVFEISGVVEMLPFAD
jgi:anti-anti-sigma factor